MLASRTAFARLHSTYLTANPVEAVEIRDSAEAKIVPKYQITFTCKACDHRSAHHMTKHAYSKGTVLIQCPSCKNRHLIADNLKIFSEQNINVEDILKAKGETIQKGILPQGNIELTPEEMEKVP